MRKYYKNGYYMCGKQQRQHQIDNVLSVYDYIGKKKRKKELPTAPERGEPDVRTRKANVSKG